MKLTMIHEEERQSEIEAGDLAIGTPHVSEFGRIEALERRFAELAGELVHVGREWLFEWNSHTAARMSSNEVAELIGAQLPHALISIQSDPEGWARSFTLKGNVPHTGRDSSPRLPIFPSRARAA